MTMESILQWSKIGFLCRYPNVNLDLCGDLPKFHTFLFHRTMKFSQEGSKHKVVPISACSQYKIVTSSKWNNLALRTFTAQFQMPVSQKCMKFLVLKHMLTINQTYDLDIHISKCKSNL